MLRAGLSTERVVDAAVILMDEVGADHLTLAELARRLGVQLPSLYKHIAGMPALERHLAVRAKTALTAELAAAAVGRSREDAVRAVCTAYRSWALAHPGLYPATTRAPDPGDPDDLAASDATVTVVFDVLRGYGLDEVGLVDATRSIRSALHGFVMLENGGGFGLDRSVDASFDYLVTMLSAELSHHGAAEPRTDPDR